MRTQRQVFFNSDARGITLLSVAVYSLLKTNDPTRPITIFIAHDRPFVDAGGQTAIEKIVSRFPFATVRFLDFTPVQEEAGEIFRPLLWAFPLCARLLPADVKGKIIYLDIDIVVRKDLGELFDLDLAGAGQLAAAVNESRREHRAYLEAAGWPTEAGYSFNNATTVVDLDAYRREGISDKIVDWYRAHSSTAINLDQDAQNVTFGARTRRLPPKWNYTDGWLERLPKLNPFAREWRVFPPREMIEAILDPSIVHYIGRRKPTSWTHRPERRLYRQMMNELGLLPNGRLPGETATKIVIGWFFDAYHALLKGYAHLLRHVVRTTSLSAR